MPPVVRDGPLVIVTPSLVMEVKGLPAASLMDMPPPLTTVLPLEPLLKVVELRPLRSLAKRTFKVSDPSDTTPKLSSVDNLLGSAIPPLTFTWLLSFFLITAPESPP